MQLILFDVTEKISIYSVKVSDSVLDLNKKSFIGNNVEDLNLSDNTPCFIIDNTSADEPKLSLMLNSLLNAPYKISTNDVTNAIKKIDASGQIIEHLNREEYTRLSTPCKATVGLLKEYFGNYSEWDLNKFITINSNFYSDYETVEPEVYLESK